MTTASRVKDMREKLDSELIFERNQFKRELFDLRFKSSAEGLANPSRIAQLRRDISRIHTLLRERQLNIRGAQTRA